ncbi:amidase [bacterium]|nr:MAG: amidase [bacterium]
MEVFMKRISALSILLVFALALTACASATPTATATTAPSGGGTNPTAASAMAAISMKSFAFDPISLTVAVGTTVTWTNNDTIPHNVTADDGSFTSGSIAAGDTYAFTFTKAGTYTYKCTIHQPDMKGTIIVTP